MIRIRLMPFTLDHLVIAVHDLDTAIQNYRTLGFTVLYGGQHASGSTHNALICFADGTYLELLAPTGQPAAPGTTDYTPLLGTDEGLIGFCLASDALPAAITAMRGRGVQIGDAQAGGRARADGVALRWQTAMSSVRDAPADALLPFFIMDETARSLRVPDDAATTTHSNGTLGTLHLFLIAHDVASEADRMAALLGVPVERAEMTVRIPLGMFTLWLTAAATDTQRKILGDRALVPDVLMLRMPAPHNFDSALTHGVVLAGRTPDA
jgi:catechol 2,3-dioxygenase-like lactoylglutathione lyase family enzyme